MKQHHDKPSSKQGKRQFATFVGTIILFTISAFISITNASDLKMGKKLYDEGCNGCHDTRIHTRPNRIIHTYEDLIGRVKFCDNAAKTGFNETQLLDVTDYLNSAFYKFIKD